MAANPYWDTAYLGRGLPQQQKSEEVGERTSAPEGFPAMEATPLFSPYETGDRRFRSCDVERIESVTGNAWTSSKSAL
jgi:hypothetical protein